jgi:multidrug efflux system outer membrane protein
LGFQSPIFKDFLKWLSRYILGGVQANQLLFDGFKTPFILERQIAVFKEASGQYQQQVLVAFQEVEDALKNIESYASQYHLAVETAGYAKTTYELYYDRYRFGLTYYIDVANSEMTLLDYQIAVNTYLGLRYVSTIQLIRALGGGWCPNN